MTELQDIQEQKQRVNALKNRVEYAKIALQRAPWREELKRDLADQRSYLNSARKLLAQMEADYVANHQVRLF